MGGPKSSEKEVKLFQDMTPEEKENYFLEKIDSQEKAQKASDAKIEELQDKVADQKKAIDNNANALKNAGKAIDGLKVAKAANGGEEAPVEPEKLEVPKEAFKVDGVSYRFTVSKFLWGGETVTAKAALEDEELLAAIVKKVGTDAARKGAGIIQTVK